MPKPVPIRQIGEVAIVVSDLDRSVRFYNEVLGLPILERHEDHASLQMGVCYIGLWLPGAWKLPHSDNWRPLALEEIGRQHFNFWIDNDDADAAIENLKQHGVRYYGPRYLEHGELHLDFEDPDGHILEYWGRVSVPPSSDRAAKA